MTDRTAGIIGLAVLIAIFVFIGEWFGWLKVLWIGLISVGALTVLGLVSSRR